MDESTLITTPGPEVTQALFLQWRSPRSGKSNPERMDNPVWDWLVKSRLDAFHANQAMNGPDPSVAGPGWSFDRFGQTSTLLPDGRTVWIGGEHEDYYDADFHIYNDVIVQHPDESLQFFGYPPATFPPTDFHTATLVEKRIIIIGCLGYPAERKVGQTFVATLNLENLAIEQVVTGGNPPGWINKHEAELSADQETIVVRGGRLQTEDEKLPLLDNIDDWELNLKNWQWRQLTQRDWPRRFISRQDGGRNHFWEIEQAVWSHRLKQGNQFHTQMKELENMLGQRPDLKLFDSLFRPPVPHEVLPNQEDEMHVFRIQLDDVVIRYAVEMYSVQLRVEGTLPESTTDALVADLVHKWSTLENQPFVVKAA